jgi:4-amino-4-deoxy-L-arabinose transferase-like glycosyltransferase
MEASSLNSWDWRMGWWLTTLSVALFLTLAGLQVHRPFVGDEVEFIKVSMALVDKHTHLYDRGFIDDVIETTQYQTWSFHPPVYMWCLGVALRVFGQFEATARGLGVAFGLITLWLVYHVARCITPKDDGRLSGALAVALCAVNPYFIQACLLIDIDGTLYTPLLLLLVYLALRLEQSSLWVRVLLLSTVFALALGTKMTTVLVFPVVLSLYRSLRTKSWNGVWEGALVGGVGTALFISAYWAYSQLMGLDFSSLFVHTARSSGGMVSRGRLAALVIFTLPLLAVQLGRRRQPWQARALCLAVFTVVAIFFVWLQRVPQSVTSFLFIMTPFQTTALMLLFYLALADSVKRWLKTTFTPLDLLQALAVAVLVSYMGVQTRGASFTLYDIAALPLITVLIANHVAQRTMGQMGKGDLIVLASLGLGYGLLVLGDSYFLTKLKLFEIEEWTLFGSIARWWANRHLTDTHVHMQLHSYYGYQSFFLGAVWHLLSLLPVALVAAWVGRPNAASGRNTIGCVAAVALGLSFSLSIHQALANYGTSLVYGHNLIGIRQAAHYINSEVNLEGFYLAPRHLAYYIVHPGFIDSDRYYGGGYKRRTKPHLNELGELVFTVDESDGYTDALPRTPIHYAVGNYPLLDKSSSYRVLRDFADYKIYAYVGLPAHKRSLLLDDPYYWNP